MHRALLNFGLAAVAVALGSGSADALKKVPYPELKVQMPAPFKGDPGFEKLRAAFADAVAKKNLAALSTLVAPNFRWTAAGEPAEEYDSKRDGLHNFKVAFGFREFGKNVDGSTEIGPQWEVLGYFANEPSLAQEPQSPLVCGPAVARLLDEKLFEQAAMQVEDENEPAEWVYVLKEIVLTASAGGGAPVGKAANQLLPVVSVHPDNPQGQLPTHVELLLPSGKSGWVSIDAVSPLFVDRLCYAKTPAGEWRISAFDQSE